jgi:hypothetical protein
MTSQTGIANWPGGFDGLVLRHPQFYSVSFVSTLTPRVLNEFRFGSRRNKHYTWNAIQRPDDIGDAARKELPTRNGQLFFPTQILFADNFIQAGQTRGQTSPIYSFTDSLSWTQGKHAFKTGAEFRLTSSNGFNFGDDPKTLFPTVTIGAGGVAVTGIAGINGLVGSNVTTAQNLLLDLSGSVSNVSYTFYPQKPTDKQFAGLVQVPKDIHQNEWGAFFKDDWKVRSNLTLNLGLRYDVYGVPWESHGLMAMPIGGNAALYGISGINGLWNPYATGGSLTQTAFTGKHSPNPSKQWYNDDWNNIAPAVGFSWSLPWLGKEKTVVRAGYAVSYQGAANYNAGWNFSNPGQSYGQNFTRLGLGAQYFNLTTIPIPVPSPGPDIVPLATEPLNTRSSSLRGSDVNRVVPYVQNWNFEIQRSLASNLTLEVRYIGTKGTKLLGGLNLNDVNIFENGLLDAFNITRQGGDAPLFDQMLKGLILNTGQPAVGTSGVTGSAALRQNTIFRSFLANGNVGQFASALNTQTTVTGQAGGLVRNGGLPENFIVVNPQFSTVRLDGNLGNSTYHSMNFQVTKRLSHGLTNQTAYTWSRSLGEASDDGQASYFNPRDRSLNKTLLNFHRTHSFRSNGTFELPFGPGRPLANGGPGWVTRIVERWQLGGIFSWVSGAPLSITASNSSFTAFTGNMPVILGDFPKSIGKVTPVANGATYFAGFTQVADPARGSVTTAQTLQNQFSNFAIADAKGNIVLANPTAGHLGTLGQRWIEGPSHVGFDVNLVKRARIKENTEFEVRVDAINVLNTPRWQDPVTDINSPNFGRLTAADPTGSFQASDLTTGTRTFTINMRLNF